MIDSSALRRWLVVCGVCLVPTLAHSDPAPQLTTWDDSQAQGASPQTDAAPAAAAASAPVETPAPAAAPATTVTKPEVVKVSAKSAVSPASHTAGTVAKKPTKKYRFLGAMLDIGAPDVLGVELVGRPARWMRMHFGVGTNLVSAGVRGGITFVPINYYISPSITIEGGKLFEGDANWLTSKFGVTSAALNKIGYEYANGHLGVELGAPNRFLFYIHAGVSYITTQVHGLQQTVQQQTNDPTITFKDPTLKYFGPSGKIGFVVYL